LKNWLIGAKFIGGKTETERNAVIYYKEKIA